MQPEAIEYSTKKEENAKCYYSKFSEKRHCSFDLQEPGLLISSSHSWIGASLNCIRKCPVLWPFSGRDKCLFKGKDLHPKIVFLLPTVGGNKDEDGNIFLDINHLH